MEKNYKIFWQVNRFDLSSNLIHLTKGKTVDDCFETLVSILGSRKILGGTGEIRGKWTCICVSEAPISAIGEILCNPEQHKFRYQPFGLVLDKNWFFSQGGRPVIYQPEREYSALPESLQYRHVSYDPSRKPEPLDFTWEREWRLRADFLELDPLKCSIIVPQREAIIGISDYLQRNEMVDRWTFIALEDLGVKVENPPSR